MNVQDGFLWGIGFLGAVLVLVAIVAIVYLAVSFSSYIKEKKKTSKDEEPRSDVKSLK